MDRTVFDWVKNGHMLTILIPNTREGDGTFTGWGLQAVKIDFSKPDENDQTQNEAYHI